MFHQGSSLYFPIGNPKSYVDLMLAYASETILEEIKEGHHYSIIETPENGDFIYERITYPGVSASCRFNILASTAHSFPGKINSFLNDWRTAIGNADTRPRVLKNIQDIQSMVWIKYPKTAGPDSMDRTLISFFVGELLNKLRKKIPHFVMTLGVIMCSSRKGSELLKPTAQDEGVYHLVQERIEGVTLAQYLDSEEFVVNDFVAFLIQIAFAIQKAQDKRGFVHNSLYPENVILRKTDLLVVSYKFGSKIYTMSIIKGIVPTIIDLSSSRVTHKEFGICYVNNPTKFTPGKDMCKLISSCLARLAEKNRLSGISWINGFYDHFFDVKDGDSYSSLFKLYQGFNLSDDNQIANIPPMSFINWVQQNKGDLFAHMVSTKTREITPKKLSQYWRDEPAKAKIVANSLPSATLKTFILLSSGQSYTPSKEEEDYDEQMLSGYNKFLSTGPLLGKTMVVNYNFPLTKYYQSEGPVNVDELMYSVKQRKNVISNYITMLRQMKALDFDTKKVTEADVQLLFSEKDITCHNYSVTQNLPLYKLHQLMEAYEAIKSGKIYRGEYPIGALDSLQEESNIIVDYVKKAFPKCIKYLNLEFFHRHQFRGLDTFENNYIYFPTWTLRQFQYINSSTDLIELLMKLFFGPDRTRTQEVKKVINAMLKNKKDDVQILNSLRRFTQKGPSFDRGISRSKDIKKLLTSIPPLNVNSYLDFGGGDGSVSTSIAKLFGVPKDKAFTADVNRWFDRSHSRKFEEDVTYITLKEDQPIPLPDNSIDVVTCFQVLHHVKNIDFVLSELNRVSKNILIIREHDCRNNIDRTLIDIEHSVFEMCIEESPNVKYLNDYQAWYRSEKEWIKLIEKHNFRHVKHQMSLRPTPSRYYYSIFVKGLNRQ